MPPNAGQGRRSAAPEARAARLHATPHRTVYAFAGAGSQALAWLHAAPGSSRTLLEATDHYHPASLAAALGSAPARSVASEVAAALARASLKRAHRLVAHDEPPGPLFGLALTATIATDRSKRGDHRIEVACADALGVRTLGFTPRKGARDRAGEERLASLAVLALAAEACGLLGEPLPEVDAAEGPRHAFEASDALGTLLNEGRPLWLDRDGRPSDPPGAGTPVPALVSGSFHPMHEGHRALAHAAEAHLGRPVAFELSLANAEKSQVDPVALRARAAQAFGERPLLLQREALFADKAEALPGTVFVVGVDTAERVLDPRFYGGHEGRDAALARVRAAGARFLVAGRAGGGGYRTLSALDVPEGGADLFEPLPAFRLDLSSTDVRASWRGARDG